MLPSREEHMTVTEVAKYLRLNARTVYSLAKNRDLPSYRVGRQYRFRRESLDKWMLAQEEKGRKNN